MATPCSRFNHLMTNAKVRFNLDGVKRRLAKKMLAEGMSWYRLPFCLFGKHKRSKTKAVQVYGHWESVCQHCGVPMEKRSNYWNVKR